MARKTKVRGLEEEINRVFSRYESNLKKAMQEAAEEAEFDIRFEAESCLYRYYENYDTNWYGRTESLIGAFVPYNDIVKDKKNNAFVAIVGMSYDPSKLDGLYSSNASKQYQPVDSSWILSNYLAGIHPTTNGYPLYADTLEYIEVHDSESPDDHMDAFLQQYAKTFNNHVLKSFTKEVIKRR